MKYMQSRYPLAGLSRRSRFAVGLCLAHALAVRLAVAIVEMPSVHQWVIGLTNPYRLAIMVPVELVTLAWLVWLVTLWLVIDKGSKRWVPVILAVGLVCLGWEGFQFVIILATWLLEHGNLGN